MTNRFAQYWVTKTVALSLLAFSMQLIAGSLVRIHGKATYEDGTPIVAANVLLLEGHAPKAGELPSFTPFARAITDAQGSFRFEVSRKVAVIVELVGDKCDWHGHRLSLDQHGIKEAQDLVANLVTTPDESCAR